ncbi:hypothetical protein BGZ76_006633, partial [Entomortierella beljakovae]
MYIHGGWMNEVYGQFISLDLTEDNWSISSPPWTPIGAGSGNMASPLDAFHSMTPTKDGTSIIVWGYQQGIYEYNIQKRTWSTLLPSLPPPVTPNMGAKTATDL